MLHFWRKAALLPLFLFTLVAAFPRAGELSPAIAVPHPSLGSGSSIPTPHVSQPQVSTHPVSVPTPVPHAPARIPQVRSLPIPEPQVTTPQVTAPSRSPQPYVSPVVPGTGEKLDVYRPGLTLFSWEAPRTYGVFGQYTTLFPYRHDPNYTAGWWKPWPLLSPEDLFRTRLLGQPLETVIH